MKLSSYIVKIDSGFAPHPFRGLCSLACCKPTIRRNAEPGDVIVGCGSASAGLAGRIVYAMRVAEVLPYDEYWERYPSRRPTARSAISQRGDNIWHREGLEWCGVPGALHNWLHRERDLRGENVLVSTEFFYFGRDAIEVPTRFQALLARTQGHRNTKAPELIERFWAWLTRRSPSRGRLGLPEDFTEAACQTHRNTAADDV